MERKFSMDKYHLQMQKINQNQKSTMLLNYQLFINRLKEADTFIYNT